MKGYQNNYEPTLHAKWEDSRKEANVCFLRKRAHEIWSEKKTFNNNSYIVLSTNLVPDVGMIPKCKITENTYHKEKPLI